MKVKFFFALVAFFLSTNLSNAQTITMNEYLDQVKQTHPLFEKEKLAVDIEKEEQNGYQGDEDWTVFSSLYNSYDEATIAFAGPERTNAVSATGGVEKTFWETGGRFSASFTTTYSDIKIDPIYAFPSYFYENEVGVSYVHPLWKNRNGFLDQLNYNLKQFDIDFSEVQAFENQEDFLAAVAVKFLDWVFLTEQKNIIQDRLSLSEIELDRSKKKRRANLIDKVDVIRAEDAVRIAKQNQVLVESQWKALQAELAILSKNNDIYNLTPEFYLYELEELMSLKEAMSELKQNSRLIKTISIGIEQLEYARKGYDNTSKPDLSLVAQANLKSLDNEFENSFDLDKPDTLVGVEFSLPLGNRTAKSQVTKTDLQIKQLKKELDDVSLSLASTLANLYIQIQDSERVLQLNKEQIQSAKERIQEELKMYNQGRGDLTFVIQSQDSEQNAKLTYASNALNYQKLIISYLSLMDKLYY